MYKTIFYEPSEGRVSGLSSRPNFCIEKISLTFFHKAFSLIFRSRKFFLFPPILRHTKIWAGDRLLISS